MKKTFFVAVFVASLGWQAFPTAFAAGVDCLRSEAALNYWRPIKADPDATASSADTLAVELQSCLASPDPELRDQIGYELFSYWLRNDLLSDQSRKRLLDELSTGLRQSDPSATLHRSYSALILAELMRSDAQRPFMSTRQLDVLLDDTVTALSNETDFRGLDAEIGWVHPIAHMSDILWRFTLHPDTSSNQAEKIFTGIKSKAAPTEAAYHFNESDRLARVATILIRRDLMPIKYVTSWIESFANPDSTSDWQDVFQSRAGMIELHNTKLFLRALSDQLSGHNIDPVIANALNDVLQFFTGLV